MCGLVGYAGHMTVAKEKAFVDLLQLDVIRGPHSTGTAFIRRTLEPTIVKGAVLPQELISAPKFGEEMRKFNTVLMGHNRWATKGAVNDANAHPFEHGDIIGTHNGTIFGQYRLPDYRTFENDSDNIFWSIAVDGIEETWQKLDGAAALVWWDGQDKQLNMLRNSKRPLSFALTKNNDGIFWASEAWMIRGVAIRHGIELDRLMHLKENYMMSWSFPTGKEIERSSQKLVPFVYQKPKISHGSNGGQGGTAYLGYRHQHHDASSMKKSPIPITNKNSEQCETLPVSSKRHTTFKDTTPPELVTNMAIVSMLAAGKSIREVRLTLKVSKGDVKKAQKWERRRLRIAERENKIKERAAHILAKAPDKEEEGNNVVPFKVPSVSRTVLSVRNKEVVEKTKKMATILGLKMEPEEEEKTTDVLREVYGKQMVNQIEFEKMYGMCGSCRHQVEFEDMEAVFISSTDAFCGPCAKDAEDNGMDLRFLKI